MEKKVVPVNRLHALFEHVAQLLDEDDVPSGEEPRGSALDECAGQFAPCASCDPYEDRTVWLSDAPAHPVWSKKGQD